MPPINLIGLYPQLYEHPEDSAALNALQHTAGLDILVRKLNTWGFERLLRVQLTGSFIHVTADALPDIYRIFLTARDRLAIPITPELYIRNAGDINAFTAGVDKPIVVLHSVAVDALTEEELLFLIGHEMGHIKSGHVLYYQIASCLPLVGQIIGNLTLGIGNLLSMGLQAALTHWARSSELTADRAGLLACQSQDAALRSMMKLAGLPKSLAEKVDVKHFIKQAQDFQNFDLSTADKIAKQISISGAEHPWTVMRAREVLTWIEGGGYQKILDMPHEVPVPRALAVRRFCDHCGSEAAPTDAFCRSCGHCLPVPHPTAPAIPATASAPLASACAPEDGGSHVPAYAVEPLR
jgi:Zn-dependent protease with chaperone function